MAVVQDVHDCRSSSYRDNALVTTANHKDIGTMYLWFSFTMFWWVVSPWVFVQSYSYQVSKYWSRSCLIRLPHFMG